MKRLFAFLLALLMVFSMMSVMTACSDSEDEPEYDWFNMNDDEDEDKTNSKDDKDDEDKKDSKNDEVEEYRPTETTAPATTDPPKPVEPVTEESHETEPPVESSSVPLTSLNQVDEKSCSSDDEAQDAYGNEYEADCLILTSYGDSRTDGEYITQAFSEYSTNGNYRYLTGTFFAKAKQDEEATIEFMVYADDELIYCSEPITRKDKAINFAIDIGNCDVLRVSSRSYDHDNTNPAIILLNAEVHTKYDGKLTKGVEINPDLVPLTDLHVYGTHSKAIDNIEVGTVEDSYGNQHKGIYLDLCSYGKYGGTEYDTQAYTEFVTNGEYRYLSGTFFTRAGQSQEYTIEFLVYADDELVYSSGMINRSTKAIDFVVEIGDCDLVRVQSRSLDHADLSTNPGIILVDPIVSTEKP